MVNTATADLAVLATSNGHSGKDRQRMGSTSKGIRNGVGRRISSGMLSLSVFGGGVVVGMIWVATTIYAY
jgi:hypothetical protein